jgi:predicted RNA-binding Zn-ribbon protein involved in translation (DUF1610 family)
MARRHILTNVVSESFLQPTQQIAAQNASIVDMAALPDNLPFVVCAGCGQVMKLIRSVPSLGTVPELHVFVCPSCGEAETMRVLQQV